MRVDIYHGLDIGERTPAEIKHNLLGAAGLIERNGLDKGQFGDLQNGMCIRGALNMVRTGNPIAMLDLEEEMAVADFLGFEYGKSWGGGPGDAIARWNNYYATQQQVIDALRAAADKIEA